MRSNAQHPSGPLRKGSFRLPNRSGVALLMVLFVVTLLTTMVVTFTDTTQKHLQVTANYKNRLQAFWTAQSGIQLAAQGLAMTAQFRTGYDAIDNAHWHCESRLYQELFAMQFMVPLPGSSSFIEPALPGTTTAEGILIRCPVVDENRKLTLHKLIDQPATRTEKTAPAVYHRLAFLLQYLLTEQDISGTGGESTPGYTSGAQATPRNISLTEAESLAAYVVDWIDTENNPRGEFNSDSAEETCPRDDRPYVAKNGILDSPDEIALVCGFRKMSRNTIERLLQHLTVYPIGTNINTATLPVLHAFCAEAYGTGGDLQETDSQRIHELLHPESPDTTLTVVDGPQAFETVLRDTLGIGDAVVQALKRSMKHQSTCFRIAFYGLVRDPETGSEQARARIEMVIDRAEATAQGPRLLYYRED